MASKKISGVDQYIAGFPKETQVLLQRVRGIVKSAAPDAEESISYMMPAFKFAGRPLVYYAGYKNHIGFYPTSTGISAFEEQIAAYKHSKGAIQFPIDKSIPAALITTIVKYKLKEIREKSAAAKK